MKAIFKGYDYRRILGKIYYTATEFEVVGENLNTAKMLRFVERHLNTRVYFHLKCVQNVFGNFLWSYNIMKNNQNIGFISFYEGDNEATLVYYDDLHDMGLTYGDYELDTCDSKRDTA